MAAETPQAQDKVSLQEEGFIDWSALTTINFAGTQLLIIFGVAVAVIVALEIAIRAFQIPSYVMPKPSEIAAAFFETFPTVAPHLLLTLRELVIGYLIGATIGILLAYFVLKSAEIRRIKTVLNAKFYNWPEERIMAAL